MFSPVSKIPFLRLGSLHTRFIANKQRSSCYLQSRYIGSIIVKDLLKQMKQTHISNIVEDEILKEAAQQMEEKKIGALMVYNRSSEQNPVGIITARDIQHAFAKYTPIALPYVHVQDVMTKRDQLISVGADDSLKNVAEMMISENIRHVPVLDENGHVLGILSIKDVVREVLFSLEKETEELKNIVTDSYSCEQLYSHT